MLKETNSIGAALGVFAGFSLFMFFDSFILYLRQIKLGGQAAKPSERCKPACKCGHCRGVQAEEPPYE